MLRPEGPLQISPDILDFGAVGVGKSITKTVTLTNPGVPDIKIDKISMTSAAFTIAGGSQLPIVVPTGKTRNMSVTFAPSSVQKYSAQLKFIDSTLKKTILLSARGIGQPGVEPVVQMSASADRLDFGAVPINTPVTKTLLLSSTGTTALTINSVSVSGSGFVVTGGMLPVTLQPKQSLTLTVHFDPTTTDTVSEKLTIHSTDVGGPMTIALSGRGSSGVVDGGSGQGILFSRLEAMQRIVSFGETTVNTSATQVITLISTGTAPVRVDGATILGDSFSLIGGSLPVTLNPAQVLTLQLRFIPRATGAASGQLTVSSNSNSGNIVVALNGTGMAAMTPQLAVSSGSLSFGDVMVNTASVQYLTLTSTGTSPVTVSSTALTGAGFSTIAGIFPVRLEPYQSLTLQVQFNPAAAGAATGQLTIVSDAANGRTTNLVLNGRGIDAISRLTASTTGLDFGLVSVNTPVTRTLTLTSVGTAAVTLSGATFSGTEFSLVGGGFPVTLDPNRSITLQIQFLPTMNGTLSGSVLIASDNSRGNVTVALNGSGTGAEPEVDLVWDPPTDSPTTVAGYHIYRLTGSNERFDVINPDPVTTVTYIDRAVTRGMNYSYIVKSVDVTGTESAASNQINVNVP